MTKWRAPETTEEKEYRPEKGTFFNVKMIRDMKVEMQMKNNPFVKKVPTTQVQYLIERTSTKIQIRSITKNTDVPFCESFVTESELLVCGFDKPGACCCICRTTCNTIWLKFCMMKTVVNSNSHA